jgi:hypothetical protein
VIPPQTTAVEIQLDIDADAEYTSFTAEILTVEGKPVWRKMAMTAMLTGTRRSITVRVEQKLLYCGYYLIKLSGAGESSEYEDLADDSFSVLKQ